MIMTQQTEKELFIKQFNEIKNRNIDLIKHLVYTHFERFMNNCFRASDYFEVGNFFTI